MTAIPQLLDLLDVQGAVKTIAAMGCQQAIAKTMTDQGADDGWALQKQHQTLSAAVTLLRNDARSTACADHAHTYQATVDGEHGRIATRREWMTAAMAWLGAKASWSHVHSAGMVESRRKGGETVQSDTRYVLTSLPAQDVRFAQAVR